MQLNLPKLYRPNELLAMAVKEFIISQEEQHIQVWLNGIKEDDYLASYFIRTRENMPALELEALKRGNGEILDIGAGAGAHSSVLVNESMEVHSLENEPGFIEILSNNLDLKIIKEDFFEWESNQTFDTILLLMNGFGISQTTDGFKAMMVKLKKLLRSTGKILVEITDYNYSDYYDEKVRANHQATFRLKYKQKFSTEFLWYYPPLEMIKELSNKNNLVVKNIFQEEESILLEIKHC